MNLIAAVDENWGIGLHGKLLVRIPSDNKRFRERTEGGVVVMGRKTLESLPNGMPLSGRENLVLTSNPHYERKHVTPVHSVREALARLEGCPDKEIFVIGGESVFRQFLPFCDKAYITKIQTRYEADAFFPNLDENPDWEITSESEEQTYFNLEYYFLDYARVKS